jgi:methionyl-tRNA formyltransferase
MTAPSQPFLESGRPSPSPAPALKVVLMGRKHGAADALRVLVERKHEVVAAISSDPDHRATPPLVNAAKALGIPVLPDDSDLYRFLTDRSIQVDLVLSYLHGRKIPERTIGLPRLGCFNFHPAPLPEYRGLGGYNFAILERQRSFGVSVHWVSPSIDRGDIVQVRRFPIDPDTETALSLEAKSQAALSTLFMEFLDLVERGGGIPGIPQGLGRYIDRRAMEEAKRVLPGEAAEAVDRKARAFWFPPFTGAFIEVGQERFTLVPNCILRNLGLPGAHARSN